MPPKTSLAPLLVDVFRGPLRESVHAVDAVVCDADGGVVHAWGDPDRLMHPRSSVKPFQALPLVETGAADAFDCSIEELALSCASHNGEAEHQRAVGAWLARIGCTDADLECGVQRHHGPSPIGNNCSGKHVGFLTVARHLGVDPKGYISGGHAVQQLVTAALTAVADVRVDPAETGIDGCGIPVHPMPLHSLATAGARFIAPPDRWPIGRREAARRLADAMRAKPFLVAGTDRLCTDLMAADSHGLLVKVGAEGVQLCALPERGIGIAIKAHDGGTRASEVALGHVLQIVDDIDRDAVFASRRRIENHAGTVVGSLSIRAN